MQLIPETAKNISRRYKVEYTNLYDLYNPEINISLGTAYLKDLLKRYDNKLEFVLCRME